MTSLFDKVLHQSGRCEEIRDAIAARKGVAWAIEVDRTAKLSFLSFNIEKVLKRAEEADKGLESLLTRITFQKMVNGAVNSAKLNVLFFSRPQATLKELYKLADAQTETKMEKEVKEFHDDVCMLLEALVDAVHTINKETK